MNEIKRLLYVGMCAAFFIGFYIISDIYASEAIGKYAYEISEGSGKLKANDKVTLDSLSVENQVMDYVSSVSHQEIKLSFVGDITFESGQLERYYNESSESFDFSESFRYISRYLKSSNYVAANLEAVMAGPDEDYEEVFDQYGTAGFLYNVPEVAAKNMKDAGISMVQTANDHSGDFGYSGVKATLDYLDKAGLQSVGTVKTVQDKRYNIVSTEGLKIGYLAYTNGLNKTLNSDDEFAINHLDNYDASKIEQMISDVRSMRRSGADVVVAMIYGGEVSSFKPEEVRKELFDQLFEAGADIIIGTEPYAVQPMEIRTLKDTDGSDKKGIAIYSLGTFLGCEQYKTSSGIDNDISVILDVIINKEGSKKAKITGFSLTPTCITYTDDDIFVLPALEVKNDPESFNQIVTEEGMERIHNASENLVPWILNDLDLTGEYIGSTYVVKF